jgi:DNA polymerase-4
MRTIFHIDMDAFFVSVEQLYDSRLKGRPVVVGGRPDERGVVAAASYEARKFGVHSAMPLRTAYRLCPQALFIEGHPDRYREHSKQVYEIFGRFSPQVEMASIDEAYMDLTGCERLFGPPLRTAHLLHEAVERETHLPCSIGIGTSRLIAKIASDLAKPCGVLWVVPGAERDFLAPLEVSRIPGVGRVMERRLRFKGIRTIGDLAAAQIGVLDHEWGITGTALAGKARGEDAGAWFARPVGPHEAPKSVSHETTFGRDTEDPELLEATLARLSQMAGRRLREYGLYGRTITLKLRHSDFSTITRARTLDEATQLDTVIFQTAQELLRENWGQNLPGSDSRRTAPPPIRLLGVQVSGLSGQPGQMSLLESERREKWRRALQAVDSLRDRYGERSIELAGGLRRRWRERVHENPAGLPGKNRPGPAKDRRT